MEGDFRLQHAGEPAGQPLLGDVVRQGVDLRREGPYPVPELLVGVPTDLLIVAEPTGNRTVRGHKGVLWLAVTARGVSAHGSRPELDRNAITALAAAASRIHGHRDWPVSPTHGPATVNIGTFHAGEQPNLVPDRAEMRLDVRTLPGFGRDEAIAEIARLCGDGIGLEPLLDLPGVTTDPSAAAAAREILAPGSSARPVE
ncbi:peptidase dimerization domain-containing protein [Streptomyces sp. PRKS01-29]|nr:peptidase dimerization domain-containing protein [Streptomyces sabulosicollis]MBI0293975.1 peptidase dimerization domain-containing protein [Streptomyces sabulosicollis]